VPEVAPPAPVRTLTITVDKTEVNVGEAFTVTGELVEDEKPLAGVQIWLSPDWISWDPSPPVTTGADGTFTVKGVSNRIATIVVEAYTAGRETVSNPATVEIVSPYSVSLSVDPTIAPYDQPTIVKISGTVSPPDTKVGVRLWRAETYEFPEERLVKTYPASPIVMIGQDPKTGYFEYEDTWIPKYETTVEDKPARAYDRRYRAEVVDKETGGTMAWSDLAVVYAA